MKKTIFLAAVAWSFSANALNSPEVQTKLQNVSFSQASEEYEQSPDYCLDSQEVCANIKYEKETFTFDMNDHIKPAKFSVHIFSSVADLEIKEVYIDLRAYYQQGEIGSDSRTVTDIEQGKYLVRGVRFPIEGTWKVRIRFKVADQEKEIRIPIMVIFKF